MNDWLLIGGALALLAVANGAGKARGACCAACAGGAESHGGPSGGSGYFDPSGTEDNRGSHQSTGYLFARNWAETHPDGNIGTPYQLSFNNYSTDGRSAFYGLGGGSVGSGGWKGGRSGGMGSSAGAGWAPWSPN